MELYKIRFSLESEFPSCQGLNCCRPSMIFRDFGDVKHYFCDEHAHLTDREALRLISDYLDGRNAIAVPARNIRRILDMTR